MPASLALSLYDAWLNHGVMAVSGGYYDQPQEWREMIDTVGLLSEYYRLPYDIAELDN